MTRNNLENLSVDFPLGVFTTVTGVSGSGKSSLVSQAMVELVAGRSARMPPPTRTRVRTPNRSTRAPPTHRWADRSGLEGVRRLVVVDQKAIGRTPRSNLATYTGLFDGVARFSPKPRPRAPDVTTLAGFRSTSPRAVANTARAKGL